VLSWSVVWWLFDCNSCCFGISRSPKVILIFIHFSRKFAVIRLPLTLWSHFSQKLNEVLLLLWWRIEEYLFYKIKVIQWTKKLAHNIIIQMAETLKNSCILTFCLSNCFVFFGAFTNRDVAILLKLRMCYGSIHVLTYSSKPISKSRMTLLAPIDLKEIGCKKMWLIWVIYHECSVASRNGINLDEQSKEYDEWLTV
jgi:hypothetical protein